jgi:Fe-S-cluster containining protein
VATRTTRKAIVLPSNGHAKNGGANGISSGFVALSLLTSPARARRPNPADGPPCHMCTARCCKYFALEIDKPTTRQDFDHIRWYLMHEGIAVWVDDGDWYLEVRTVCNHLQPDNTCGIYENRPQVCRDYGTDDDEGPCEYFTEHLKYDCFWDSDVAFETWYKAEAEKKRKKRARQRALQRKAAGASLRA